MEIAEHIDALRRQGTLLADAADRAGLDAAVPPCPPWLVKDLLRHTGYIHRWAARHITERPTEVIDGPPEPEILKGGPADPDLLSWFRAGHAALVQTLATADPDLECATFLNAPSPLAFWARRQAHETAIHRADAESALGILPEFPADFAADGIDELIMGFGRRRKYQPPANTNAARDTNATRLHVIATDTTDHWYVDSDDGRTLPHRKADDPAPNVVCTVTGPASAVYLFLWNRADAAQASVTITGSSNLLTSWLSAVRVRWA